MLSIETKARCPCFGFWKKRKSPSTVRRNNERTRKYQEKKAGRNVASMPPPPPPPLPPPPPVTPSLPSPSLSPLEFNQISRSKCKHLIVSSASSHSEYYSVSELMASPILQLDGPPEVPASPSDNALGSQASPIPGEAINVTSDPQHDSARDVRLEEYLHQLLTPIFNRSLNRVLHSSRPTVDYDVKSESEHIVGKDLESEIDYAEEGGDETEDDDQLDDLISLVKRTKTRVENR